MRPYRFLLITSAACALALTAAQVAAQQSAPASSTSSMSMSSTSNMSMPANNSGVNKRDRSSAEKTPVDQPNDKADIKLAAAVRRAIVKDKTLSLSAHNVKLVAAQGVVTLRGPVENADEKARIEADVKAVSGVTEVNNQLDTKH